MTMSSFFYLSLLVRLNYNFFSRMLYLFSEWLDQKENYEYLQGDGFEIYFILDLVHGIQILDLSKYVCSAFDFNRNNF